MAGQVVICNIDDAYIKTAIIIIKLKYFAQPIFWISH